MIFKNLAIPVKQMMGYLIGILLLTILFAASVAHFSTLASDYNSMMANAWRQLNHLQDLRAHALQVRIDIDENIAKADYDLRQMNDTFNALMAGGHLGLPQDVMLIVKDMIAYQEQTAKLVVMKKQKNGSEMLRRQQALFNKAYYMFMGRIYVEIEKSKSHVAIQETRYLQRISYLLVLNTVLAPLSFAFLYIYGFFLSNYTGVRLQKFLAQMKDILAGNYQAKISDDGRDEIGQIAAGINDLADRLARK